MNKKLVAFIIFFGLFQFSYAQDQQCIESLNQARDDFNAGHLEGIAGILHDCINNGFSKEQKVEAYRILTITYLYLEDPFGAEQSFLALLAIEPEFRVSPTDPVELEYLSKQYITTPIISYSFKAGANFSTATVLHRNPIGDSDWNYTPGTGINVIGGIDIHFNKVVSLTAEIEFSTRVLIKDRKEFATEPQTIESTRTNIHGSIPVSLRFTYPGVKYYPYVYGGYSPAYTLFANTNSKRDPIVEARINDPNLNIKPHTPEFSHSLIFGAGLKRRFGLKYAMVDFRYRLGMTNMTKEDTQFDFIEPVNNDNREKIFNQLDVDDDFRWNGFEVAVGIVWPIYKPRAKNTVTIQTVVRKWFGKKNKGNE